VLEILSTSPVGPTATAKRGHILAGSYPPRFKLSLAAKDLRLVTEEAARAGLELGIAGVARGWLERAERDGRGDEDYSAVVETITEPR
jgi:3-hydroxyisobutyrate dehydrogenase-like beta-hydroxyacid dehydrogenase